MQPYDDTEPYILTDVINREQRTIVEVITTRDGVGLVLDNGDVLVGVEDFETNPLEVNSRNGQVAAEIHSVNLKMILFPKE